MAIVEHLINILFLQTLAKVVDGWKKHENEKAAIINQLKVERETAEQSQQRQQEVTTTPPGWDASPLQVTPSILLLSTTHL